MEMNLQGGKKDPKTIKKDAYERAAWALGQPIMGLDEVGRGCLAGPVVTAAVMLPVGKTSRLLRDSKLMTASEREKAYMWIIKHCHFGIGIVSHEIIDTINIWHATLRAMRRASLHALAISRVRPHTIVVDAMPVSLASTNYHEIPICYFPFGERKSSSIAAASIVAKVTRDRLMGHIDPLFPLYGLKTHKGYATKVHQAAVAQYRHSIIHRMTFLDLIGTPEHEGEESDYAWQKKWC